jgi:nucleotide-binding universal stress UspA family protein
VVTVATKQMTEETMAKARAYLHDHQLQTSFIHEAGKPADVIMHAARARDCDLIVMGGYGAGATREIMIGSVVDEVLRTRNRPVLICR